MQQTKQQQLLILARKRQQTRLPGYACIGDFAQGVLECNHVSPLTKSGNNLNAKYMVIAQDWSSAENLKEPDNDTITLGYSRKWATNKNLDALLLRHFGLDRSKCYMTNLFPFVKPGNASTHIPMRDLVHCAREFTLPEIAVVQPLVAICLGMATYVALMKALAQPIPARMADAIANPIHHNQTAIHCVAHTGARGMNNRGRDLVEIDWQCLATLP